MQAEGSPVRAELRDDNLTFFSRVLGGELHFMRFETRHMERVVDIVKSNRCGFYAYFRTYQAKQAVIGMHASVHPSIHPSHHVTWHRMTGCTTASTPWGAQAGAPTSSRRCSRHVFVALTIDEHHVFTF